MGRGGQTVAVSATFTAIAFCFVITRCAARFVIVKHAGLEDALIIAALGMSIALTALIAHQAENGLGSHFDTLEPGQYERMLKSFWASVIVYNTGLILTKDSILFQFLRFFVDQMYRRICWGMMVLVTCYGISIFISSIFACTPISYFWHRETEGGRCMNLLAFWFCNSAFNILTDLAVVILPIPVLKSLQLPRKQKWGLLLVFTLGGFTCITSIVRLHSIQVIATSKDVTWDNVGAATWSAVELNTAIVCACLPTIRPVVNLILPRLLQSSHRGTIGGTVRPYYRESSSATSGFPLQQPEEVPPPPTVAFFKNGRVHEIEQPSKHDSHHNEQSSESNI